MSGDFSLTTFNSQGKLKQIENALKAVTNGETAVGIRYATGVVLAVEKNIKSPLVDENSVRKIQKVSDHVGATYAGLSGDFRVLLQTARKQGLRYDLAYEEPILMGNLARETAKIFQEFTQSGGVRPFGISLLVAGIDYDGPQLFQLDPSGVYHEWRATSIGKNGPNAKIFLEKRYKENMDRDDAIHTALLALKDGFEGVMNQRNVEVGYIDQSDRVFRNLSQREINDILSFISD